MENQVQDLLNQTRLNWSVRTENLQTSSGIIIPDKIGIIREDDSTVLGIHSSGYVPYQNEQMMELLYKVSNKTGLEIHSGGLFNGGGKVYVQLKSDDLRLGTELKDTLQVSIPLMVLHHYHLARVPRQLVVRIHFGERIVI